MLSLDNLLVARDFSSVSDRALRQGLDLAARTGATLHVLHADVLHDGDGNPPPPDDGIDALRAERKDSCSVPAVALDAVSVVTAARRDVAPAPAILGYAADEGIDLIALGTHGRRGPSRILLGSVAEEVVRRADVPVLTVRGEEEDAAPLAPLDRILVPVDFSDHAREALRTAAEWADLYDADVDVLHVVEEDLPAAFYVGGVQSIYDVEPDLEDKVRDRLTDFVSGVLGSTDGIHPHMRAGSAASEITEFVDERDTDLVALSTHGRTGLERFLLGSVTEKIVRHVHCPVLTVKAFGQSLVSAPTDASSSPAS
jgi:nucleotide-binding universal stress UspA family protein